MKQKKAFTLVEMLVVIGILGVLVSVTIVAMSGGTQSANNIKCETNLRNLATACQNYGMTNGFYPLAGSVEKRNDDKTYTEIPGWISWYSQDAYGEEGDRPTSHQASMSWWSSTYTTDEEERIYCLTNGVLWKYVSGNREVYRCPVHVSAFRQTPPTWSYVMNAYFGWDNSKGQRAKDRGYVGKEYGHLARADRRLLFAELPFMGYEGVTVNDSASAGEACDCTLQYNDGECIGFNHKSGKRDKFAMVVFADAHTERISLPRDGLTENNLKELTKLLCTGKDIVLDNNHYKELQ